MKTICIKTNNKDAINYLLENFKSLQLEDVCFSCHKFKVYNNILIHYKGKDVKLFLSTVSNILSNLVFDNFEDDFIKAILNQEYFYFDAFEKKQIIDKTNEIYFDDIEALTTKESILFNTFYNFLKSNKKLYLKGFLTFRLKRYFEELGKTVDNAINQYLIEKEYLEFVSLLKLYVNSEESKIDVVHLVYNNKEPLLLDKNKNDFEYSFKYFT